MEKKLDRRVLKSRQAIEQAFIFLLEQKGFDNLTVKEIAAVADVGRKTFYLHFTDLYDLLDHVLDKEMAGLATACEQKAKQTYAEGALSWFRYFTSHKKLFLPLFISQKTTAFRDRLFRLIINDLTDKAQSRGIKLDEIDCHFFSMAIVGTIESIMLGQMQNDMEKTARRVGELLEKNLQTTP